MTRTERYIESKSNVLSPSTVRGYKTIANNQFQMIMNYKLKNIDNTIIQTAINEMAINHSPKTIRNAHGLIHSVLKAYYPSLELNTRLPQKIKPEYIIPTTDEVNRLIEFADERLKAPIMLAAYGSLRRGEICALTIDDITDTGVVVNKAVVYDDNYKLQTKQPKTNAGNRFCPLPQFVIKEVRNWQNFGCTPAQLEHWFIRTRDKAELPKFSFHKLRHYFASELHAKGIPDKYICQVGGWENVSMLHNIYEHTLRDKEKTMQNQIVNIFTEQHKQSKNITQNITQKNKKA